MTISFNNNNYNNTNLLNYIDTLCKDRNLDKGKLISSVEEVLDRYSEIRSVFHLGKTIAKNIAETMSPKTYYETEKNVISYTTLFNYLRENNYVSNNEEEFLVMEIIDWVCANDKLSAHETKDLLHQITSYLETTNKKTSKELVNSLIKTKKIENMALPLEDLKKNAQKKAREWEEMLNNFKGE